MSRRPTVPADRAAQNQQTIKALLKLEGNKICGDCKRNKHPRWASWNIGVFVCIRCSGIHRGMGTHISRVKSVDLDTWTDEQLQSVLKWGNSRANKYWEAKLAPGHMPSEAKIENFIRTKYESKRWVMDGPMPDPSTLDAEGDDDVPLGLVQEKAKIERSRSLRAPSAPSQPLPPPRQAAPPMDLFGESISAPPVRPNTTENPKSKLTATPAPPRQPKPGESLLGLDFFGNAQPSHTARPSSASSNPINSTGTSRPDLKQSILSLYASKPQSPPAQSTHERQPSFGGKSPNRALSDPFGGLNESLSGLSFSTPMPSSVQSPPANSRPPSSTLRGYGNIGHSETTKSVPAAPKVTSPPPLSGGAFFDTAPTSPPVPPKQPAAPARSTSNGLDFAFAQVPVSASKPPTSFTTNELFASDDFSGFASAPPPAPASLPGSAPTRSSIAVPPVSGALNSPFNLSASSKLSSGKAPAKPAPPVVSQTNSAFFDPWSSANEDAWGATEPTSAKPQQSTVELGRVPSRLTPNDISGGWGSPLTSSKKPLQSPAVAADEDFGGWTSASTTQIPAAGPAKASGGFGAASDPFDNPWG